MEQLEELYQQYLTDLQKKNFIERYVGKESRFNASSAGRCHKIHWWKYRETEQGDNDFKSMLRMRLGDLVHEDIQNAILRYSKVPVLTEYETEIKRLNVGGYADIVILDGKEVEIYDIKTIAAYSYKRKFGRKENREPDPMDNYEYQLGTLGLGFQEQGFKIRKLGLIYYKKDDSTLKHINVPLKYIKLAEEYWTDILKLAKKDDEPEADGYPMPVRSWECGYCPYSHVCDTPFKKEK